MTSSTKRHAGAPMPSDTLTRELAGLVRQALINALLPTGTAADQAALTVERAAASTAPQYLARSHPLAARAEAQALYARCLSHYRAVLRPQDQDSGVDDVGAALAHFVAANMRALRGAITTPDVLLQLERQLCGVIQHGTSWSGAAAHERQFYFEQLAILAVLIGETWSLAAVQGPAAMANVQRAAGSYLQQLLGIDAAMLTLDRHGLRDAEQTAPADVGALA
jgi:hypothetical protein